MPSFSHTCSRKPTLAPGNVNVKFTVSAVAFEASSYLDLFYLSHLVTTTLQHEYVQADQSPYKSAPIPIPTSVPLLPIYLSGFSLTHSFPTISQSLRF